MPDPGVDIRGDEGHLQRAHQDAASADSLRGQAGLTGSGGH